MELKKLLKICGILIILSIAIEIFFIHPHHVEFWYHDFTGFDAIFGIIGSIVLVAVSKGLGSLFIQREESYWDGGETDD